MVEYTSSDVIPIAEFEFAWRITDPRWSALPEPTLKRIKALSDARSKQLFEQSPLFVRDAFPFDPRRYHAVAQSSLEENSDSDCARIKTWLRGLPVPVNAEVYVCWLVGEGVAVVTDWQTFIEVWNDFWYPFDRLGVFDESSDWALIMGPEEYTVFIQRGPVNPQLPISDPAYGLALLQPSYPNSGG